MPEVFKFYNTTLTTANVLTQNIYTSPANTTSIVFLGQLSNIDPSNTAAVNVATTKSGSLPSTSNSKYLAFTLPIPIQAATTFLTGKLVLEAGDTISASANANSRIDISLSVLQLT